jgi:hypothetical protein
MNPRGARAELRRQIYLHIGYGKTGTSAVQSFLAAERERLLLRGVLYPKCGMFDHAHHLLTEHPDDLLAEMAEHTRALYDELLDEIEASGADRIVLSSEHFCFMPEAHVRQLAEIFGAFEVKVIFYVRNPFKLIRSTYLQRQKQGLDYCGDIQSFYELHRESFDFEARIRPWRAAFTRRNIIVRLYDSHAVGTDTTRDFLNIIGIQRLTGYAPKRENASLIPELSRLVSLVDTFGLSAQQRSSFIAELLDVSNTFRKHSSQELMGAGLFETIEATHGASNVEFAAEYLTSAESSMFLGGASDGNRTLT